MKGDQMSEAEIKALEAEITAHMEGISNDPEDWPKGEHLSRIALSLHHLRRAQYSDITLAMMFSDLRHAIDEDRKHVIALRRALEHVLAIPEAKKALAQWGTDELLAAREAIFKTGHI